MLRHNRNVRAHGPLQHAREVQVIHVRETGASKLHARDRARASGLLEAQAQVLWGRDAGLEAGGGDEGLVEVGEAEEEDADAAEEALDLDGAVDAGGDHGLEG